MTLLLVALGGGLGAGARFVVDGEVARRNRLPLPLGTLVVNTVGSLLLGVLAGWLRRHGGVPELVWAGVVGTGFCGGFTTFSTAHVEAARLWLAEGRLRGAGYAVLTLLAGVAAAGVGLVLGSSV